MLLAEAACFIMCFILYSSGVQGRRQRICALKGTSVDLPCSAQRPTSSMTWHTVHLNGSTFPDHPPSDKDFVQNNIIDGNNTRFNMSAERNFTLTISNLTESDTKYYCCGNITDNPRRCWSLRTELHVADGNLATYNVSAERNFSLTLNNLTESDANIYCCKETTDTLEKCRGSAVQLCVADLQVQVIPTTEGQTVTLMCSTSCALTETTAVYIWYKNRESLYQDWSPWYQELVSSEEAVRYSCAIEGYEDLRAPEVSVDSVTPSCFTVTYAKDRVCPYRQTSGDESCSITYPTALHVQRTQLEGKYIRLSCSPSCPLTSPHTAYRWFLEKRLYRHTERQNITADRGQAVSCAVKGHEALRSDEICVSSVLCWRVNYISRRICALEGSSLNISSEYLFTYDNETKSNLWFKRNNVEDYAGNLANRLVFHNNILILQNLRRNDSAEYVFKIGRYDEVPIDSPGVTLFVTGLKVKFAPSAVVTEDQRVTLTCSTSCPLTNNTNYIWFFNSRPLTLTEHQNKHLVLDPVSSQHAGNYSCAAKTQTDIRSPAETLTVKAFWNSMAIINVVRLAAVTLIPLPLLLFHLWLRVRSSRK